MTSFARLDGNTVCDIQPNDTEAEYRARNTFFASWPVIVQVKDDTQNGAVSDGAGGWVNPVPSPAALPFTPILLSASGFQDTCETGFGGAAIGPTRFGAVIRAMSASNDDLVFSLYQRFIKSVTFDKTKSAAMLAVLVAKGIITAPERVAILAAWTIV